MQVISAAGILRREGSDMHPAVLLASLALAPPTYRDVAPILQRKCCGCHQAGGAAPMALGSYADAVSWSESVREAVAARRMPPWHADPRYGHFRNDRSLSAPDRATLLAWIHAGCPQGRPIEDTPAGPGGGWRIKPDVVIEMPEEQSLPASGLIPYRNVDAPTGFAEDVWVTAAEIRPGNHRAVHHLLVFVSAPDKGIFLDYGMLASYLPGAEPLVLPPGYAKRIPAGVPIGFRVHYTATGKPEKDRSSIGLVLAKRPPAREVRSVNVEGWGFEIPPGASNLPAKATRTCNQPIELLTLTPHMHLRGKDFKYDVTYPDGRAETLLDVPHYDFNWQTTYHLAEPLALPAGSRIDCTAHYDNSAANPNNPDPTQTVRTGGETDDEMLIGFVDFAIPPGAGSAFSSPPPSLLAAPELVSPTGLAAGATILSGSVLLAGVAAVRLLRRRTPGTGQRLPGGADARARDGVEAC